MDELLEEGGCTAITQMCGFSSAEFDTVSSKVEAIENAKWTSGWGQKSRFSTKEMLFLPSSP